ncbi:MAG: helix-turn-helix domain-containing GNAT family N-acetyltransferase [Gemmatimonadota bacterium]
MNGVELERRIDAVRRFNRFYAQKVGVLRRGYLNSPFTLTEARVLYELAQHEPTTAARLGRELGLDAGYLSRILRGFREHGLIERRRSDVDGREHLISLTEAGREAFGRLDAAARGEIEAMLTRLSPEEQDRLVRAMGAIEWLLGGAPERRVSYILRPHQPGDMGWVVHRHGVLYNQEYGWDERFEALVAQIVADFIRNFDPRRERCWIAEMNGEPVGSVFLVKHPEREGVAKLRLLLVEPRARGLGIGRRLVQECTRFARQAGYRKITLWTNDVLVAARRIYEREGYRLVHREPHAEFGEGLVGETWELSFPHGPGTEIQSCHVFPYRLPGQPWSEVVLGVGVSDRRSRSRTRPFGR